MKGTAKLLTTVICSCLLLVSCTDVQNEATPDYTLTENEYVNYIFEYPNAWELVRNDGMIIVKSPSDNVSISCTTFEPDDPTMLANEYWDGYFESFKNTFGASVEIISEEETKLGGAAAKYVTYTAEIVGDTYQFTQVVAIANGTAYTLTYTAKPETHETYKSALTHIITSFSFKG